MSLTNDVEVSKTHIFSCSGLRNVVFPFPYEYTHYYQLFDCECDLKFINYDISFSKCVYGIRTVIHVRTTLIYNLLYVQAFSRVIVQVLGVLILDDRRQLPCTVCPKYGDKNCLHTIFAQSSPQTILKKSFS